MCSTRAVAESTNCSCALNPRQAIEQTKQDQPVTSAIMLGLGRVLVWAVGAVLIAAGTVAAGLGMVLAWACNGVWGVMVWAWNDMFPLAQDTVCVEPVATVQPVVVKATPGIAVVDWPTSKHNIVKVAHD